MLDLLISVPGPQFLQAYLVLCVVTIAVCKLWARTADSSLQYPSPNPKNFDPVDIAALKGGRNAVIRTTVFDLWQRDIIRFSGEGQDAQVSLKAGQGANEIESAIIQYAMPGRTPAEFFSNKDLAARIDMALVPVYAKLERAHLLQSPDTLSKGWRILWTALAIIVGVGGTKLVMGIIRGKPFLYLLFMLIVAVILAVFFLKPREARVSLLGVQYLKLLEKHFGWLKDSLGRGVAPEGINPALALAIFGVAGMAGVTMFSPFSEAFRKAGQQNNSGGGCSGGCSGGCGSSCGGGCGGGCGGCGGD